MSRARTSGFLLGKFLPPHRGHQYLIDFARASVNHLTVLACSIASEPIPGELRYRWMREAFPGVDVIHHTAELPQAPEEHPDFWDMWRTSIRRHVLRPIDSVFASEPYGARLAHELDAAFVPVDLERRNVPVSGRAIRADPLAHWSDLLAPVRPYYLKRVCVLDPARTSLPSELANAFDTSCLHAYGDGLQLLLKAGLKPGETVRLYRAQAAAESALARQANRILIFEVDALTIRLLAEAGHGTCPPELRAAAPQHPADLYIVRDRAETGSLLPDRFLDRLKAACSERHVPVVILRGNPDIQFALAQTAVGRLLRPPAQP